MVTIVINALISMCLGITRSRMKTRIKNSKKYPNLIGIGKASYYYLHDTCSFKEPAAFRISFVRLEIKRVQCHSFFSFKHSKRLRFGRRHSWRHRWVTVAVAFDDLLCLWEKK